MTFLESWEDFEQAAERLYLQVNLIFTELSTGEFNIHRAIYW